MKGATSLVLIAFLAKLSNAQQQRDETFCRINDTEYEFARYEIGDQNTPSITGQFQYYDWAAWCVACEPPSEHEKVLTDTTFQGSILFFFQTTGCEHCGPGGLADFSARHGAEGFVYVQPFGTPGKYTRRFAKPSVYYNVPETLAVGEVIIPFKEWDQFAPEIQFSRSFIGFSRNGLVPDISDPSAWDGKLNKTVTLEGFGNEFMAFNDAALWSWSVLVGITSAYNAVFASSKMRRYWLRNQERTSKFGVMALEAFSNLLRIVYCIDPFGNQKIFSYSANRILITISGPFSFISVVLLTLEYREAIQRFNNLKKYNKTFLLLVVTITLVTVEIVISMVNAFTNMNGDALKKTMGALIIFEQIVVATFFVRYATLTLNSLNLVHSSSTTTPQHHKRVKRELKRMSKQVRYLAICMYSFCIFGYLSTDPVSWVPLPHYLMWLGVFLSMNASSFFRINSLVAQKRDNIADTTTVTSPSMVVSNAKFNQSYVSEPQIRSHIESVI